MRSGTVRASSVYDPIGQRIAVKGQGAVDLFARLQQLSMRSVDRRQFAAFSAAIVASLVVPDEAPAAKRQRRNKRGRGDAVDGGTSQTSRKRGKNRKRTCGGLTGRPCPRGYICVDDPSDSCDPSNGGADCGGICVKESVTPNPCAAMLCIEGTDCCPNCGGLCVPRGTVCSDRLCGGERCGATVCEAGTYCCNASCNRCAPLGMACTQEACNVDPPPGEQCGPRTCPSGQFCCNPECGVCSPNPNICPMIGCVPSEPQPCGKNFCGPGEYCCNRSCGTCAPLDGACTQQVCSDDDLVIAAP